MGKAKWTIGPDVDLDEEVVLLANGERLTEALADKWGREQADQMHELRRGRPSLTGEAAKTPQIGARVPAEVRAKLEARAAAEGKKLSQVVRDALEAYVA